MPEQPIATTSVGAYGYPAAGAAPAGPSDGGKTAYGAQGGYGAAAGGYGAAVGGYGAPAAAQPAPGFMNRKSCYANDSLVKSVSC